MFELSSSASFPSSDRQLRRTLCENRVRITRQRYYFFQWMLAEKCPCTFFHSLSVLVRVLQYEMENEIYKSGTGKVLEQAACRWNLAAEMEKF